MNMLVFNRLCSRAVCFVTALLLFTVSCKKESPTSYIYGVNTTTVSQDGVSKPNPKSTVEFISIAYSDLFGNTIDLNTLNELGSAYEAFGDKKLIEDLIIRNMLNAQQAIIPSQASMSANVPAFIVSTYKKFYNREPNEFELWQFTNLINTDTSITPELVYYAFMTSNEYRYY